VRPTLLFAAHVTHQSPKKHPDQSRACTGPSQHGRSGLVARDPQGARAEIPHAEGDEHEAQSEEEWFQAVHVCGKNIPLGEPCRDEPTPRIFRAPKTA
jgi:hypothetical protein